MISPLWDTLVANAVAVILTISSLLLVSVIYKTILYPEFLTPLRDIPTPPNRSLLRGNYLQSGSDSLLNCLRHWSATVPNQGLIRYYQTGNSERLLATSPEALNDILVVRESHFAKPKAVKGRLSYITGNGLLLAEGEVHRIQRKALMPAFAFRHIKALYPIFWSKATGLTELLKPEIQSKKEQGDQVIEVRAWSTRATLDIIGLAGMGCDFESLKDPNNHLVRQYRQLRQEPSRKESLILFVLSLFSRYPNSLLSRFPTQRVKQIRAASDRIRQACTEVVATKKRELGQEKNGDIIDIALRSEVFSDANLVDQMMTFLAAGHGTTSHALQWAIYALCKHPEMQTRLRQELRDNLPSLSNREASVSAEDIDGLPYLHAVCSETLRFYPPVPTTVREAVQDTTVAGYRIPRGTSFAIAPGVINLNPELWGPDAGEFNPERWMKEGCANSGGVKSHHGFLTFLQGPRSCIGATFAKAELACLVAALVGRFRLELESPHKEEEMKKQGVGSAPADGVRAKFEVIEGCWRVIETSNFRLHARDAQRPTRRLEEVEQELEQIKRDRADQRQPQRPNPDNIELADVPVTDTSVIEVSPDVAIHSNGKAIGMVHVPSTLIGVLLDEYFTHYDALCPILPRVGVFVKYSDSCPLLFWTVLVTAMRRKSEHRELYSSLVDVVQTMAFEAASPQHKSLLTLQGLLLLCYWPLPFRRNEDPSHSLLAIATHLGLRLGLHRPHHRADFEGSSSEDNTTTILKRITLSAQLGLPPTARLDPGLLEILAAKPRWLPDTLYFQLHLARRALSITLTLGCSETSATGLLKEPDPFIRNFETDFQALDYQFSPSWSPADQILFLGCRIMLYTFALADRGKWKDSLQHETSSHWLIRAYLTATTTIQAASSMKSYLIYAPARSIRSS
ncbi:hypothetical protein ARAM_001567 [Aspergillus rambellii]|uniref:Xylanolytic transcriptional activator regulatory domain-containing protein n=1 Tax=Aspergillus rambellii TaxID=308745 RepID=A0A0F8V3I7_9EURO|nr:hypothetical protein ARAM_001567 [Aspergillus rambellii]